MRNVVFVASLFFMAALVPRSECAPTPLLYCTVMKYNQLGQQNSLSRSLFLYFY